MFTFGVLKLLKNSLIKKDIEMGIIKSCQIIFADDKIEKEFNDLNDNEEIKKWINRAKDDIIVKDLSLSLDSR